MLIPTTCFNCESACGLLAYVDPETLSVRKFEGNPEHPASRGRNCAKGPATLNQINNDPDRILYSLKRAGERGEGKWQQVSWDEALRDIAGRLRRALQEGRHNEIMGHVGRPGEMATPSAYRPPGASMAATLIPTSARPGPAPDTIFGWGRTAQAPTTDMPMSSFSSAPT